MRRGWVGHVVLIVIAIGTVVPFISIVAAALHPPGATVSGLSWPDELTFENFANAWTAASFGRLLRNSLLVAAVVVPLVLLAATLAGYALATMKLRLSHGLFVFFVAGLTIPVELVVIPLYFDLRSVGLANSLWGVILAEVGLFIPFGVFWMTTHFRSMPEELIDAARIDGATPLRVLRSVLLPLSKPALSTLAVLVFMWSWNQFLLVLILIQDTELRTAPAGLGFFVGQYTTDIPVLSAGTLIVILPIVAVYLAFQRNFISGLLQGAVKG